MSYVHLIIFTQAKQNYKSHNGYLLALVLAMLFYWFVNDSIGAELATKKKAGWGSVTQEQCHLYNSKRMEENRKYFALKRPHLCHAPNKMAS